MDPQSASRNPKTLRVLILEDVPRDADLEVRELRREGIDCDVLVVSSSEEMIRALDDFRPDVILSDYAMPQFTGMDALKLRNEHAQDIPFVVVTASINEETAADCIKQGADDYVTKDHLAHLVPAVRNAIEKKRLQCAQKDAQAVIHRTAQEWSTTFDAMQEGVALLDTDFKFMRCNKVLCNLIGRPLEQIIGQHCSELVHGLGAHPAECPSIRAARSLKRETWQTTIGDRWFDVVADPVLDDEGRLTGIVHTMSDITKRKHAEEALHQAHVRLRSFVDSNIVGVAVAGSEGQIFEANDYYLNLIGFTRAEFERGEINWRAITPPEWLSVDEKAIAELHEHGACTQYEKEYVRRDGTRVSVLIIDAMLPGPGEQIVAFVLDITDRKSLEGQLRQAQKIEALGTLAGGIAHDFNNILGIIFGYAEMAMTGSSDSTSVTADIEQILRAAERAKELVKQILAFARPGSDENIPVKVSLIIKETMKMLRASLPTTIDIRLNIDSQGIVMTAPTKIHQILMNLCTNAYHAMHEHGGTLTVSLDDVLLPTDADRLEKKLDSRPYIKLSVADTGYGMDKTVMERIFDPYFTTKPIGEGTGLGLSVVHGIVKNLGGNIWVDSVKGMGSSFEVWLPMVQQSADVTTEYNKKPLPRGNERVLLVDDEISLLNVSKEILKNLGYSITTETDSMAALELFKSDPYRFDLIITDQTMPNLTGFEMARQMLSVRAEMPIIICTGFSDLIDEDRAGLLGIRKLIMKPLDSNTLASAVRSVLNGEKRHNA